MAAQGHLRARGGFVETHGAGERFPGASLDENDIVPIHHVIGIRRAALQVRPVRHQEAKVGLEEEFLAVDAAAGGPSRGGAIVADAATTGPAAATGRAAPAAPTAAGAPDALVLGGAKVEEEVRANALAASGGLGVRVGVGGARRAAGAVLMVGSARRGAVIGVGVAARAAAASSAVARTIAASSAASAAALTVASATASSVADLDRPRGVRRRRRVPRAGRVPGEEVEEADLRQRARTRRARR